ncbi:MAG: GNAT family N-acetyltransferase [Chloroflexota bacterium]
MIEIERLQAQLHYAAAQNLERVEVPPFVCYFHPTETAVFTNYAIPLEPIDQNPAALAQLKITFQQRNRTPRFEYLEAFAPNLAFILQASGFVEEMRSYLMACTPQTLTPLPNNVALAIRLLTNDEPVALRQAFVTIQGRSFGSADAPMATEAAANATWQQFSGVGKFMAWWEEEPVAVGSLTQAHDGIAEVAGIATLSDFRKRGIGTAVTHYITAHAFAQGLEAVFLTAGDERADRVYAQVGYQPMGAGLAYLLSF